MIEDMKKTLFAAADKLRANMDAAEYKHFVLGLIFLIFIFDTFQTRCKELTSRFNDRAHNRCLPQAKANATLRNIFPPLISAQLRLPEAEALVEEAAA